MYKVLGISGSLRRASFNTALLEAMQLMKRMANAGKRGLAQQAPGDGHLPEQELRDAVIACRHQCSGHFFSKTVPGLFFGQPRNQTNIHRQPYPNRFGF